MNCATCGFDTKDLREVEVGKDKRKIKVCMFCESARAYDCPGMDAFLLRKICFIANIIQSGIQNGTGRTTTRQTKKKNTGKITNTADKAVAKG